MQISHRLALALASIAVVACSGTDEKPTAPAAPIVATVTVALSSPTIQVAQTASATVTALDQTGTAISVSGVTWSTSSASVATVSAEGVVTGVGPGDAMITASVDGKQGQQAITVIPVPVDSVTVAAASTSMFTGDTLQLTAFTLDARGTMLTGRTITWTASDSTIATVSATGMVTALAAGTATITATSEGKSGTIALTIAPVAADTTASTNRRRSHRS